MTCPDAPRVTAPRRTAPHRAAVHHAAVPCCGIGSFRAASGRAVPTGRTMPKPQRCRRLARSTPFSAADCAVTGCGFAMGINYMRNLLGWQETRLAQITLTYISIA